MGRPPPCFSSSGYTGVVVECCKRMGALGGKRDLPYAQHHEQFIRLEGIRTSGARWVRIAVGAGAWSRL